MPDGPFPVLVVTGEQSSAKSTTIKVAKALIDPSELDVRSPPKDKCDLMIAARHSRVLAYDNLSSLSASLSDALCRLATGGAVGKRALYTDADEAVLKAKRPLILGCITDYADRADLLDRAIVLRHPWIPDGARRTEGKFWPEFRAALPGILGALFTYVAGGLRELQNVADADLPRMADAAAFALACEQGSGAGPRFRNAYCVNRADADEDAVADSPVAAALCPLMDARDEWRGSPTLLLAEFSALSADPRARELPKGPNALTGRLRRDAPALRRARGIEVDPDGRLADRERTRVVAVTHAARRTSAEDPRTVASGPAGGDRPHENTANYGVADDEDGADGVSRSPSGGRRVWHTSERAGNAS